MIRKAAIQDASRLAEILIFSKRVAYRTIFNNDKVSFGEMQVLPLALEYVNRPDMLKNVFVYDDIFVKGMMHISAVSGEDTGQISQLYIDPFFQNQNLGSKLLEYGENFLRDLSIPCASLWVLEKNEKARNFYRKKGFIDTGQKKLEQGTSEYILRYEKSI